MKSLVLRLLIIACGVAITQWPAWSVRNAVSRKLVADNLDTSALPLTLGAWSGRDITIKDGLLRQIGASSATQRNYEGPDGSEVSAFLATSSAVDCLVPHPPAQCYAGSGWMIAEDAWKLKHGQRQYRLMRMVHGDQAALVMYWYQVGGDVVSNREELRKVLQDRRWNHQDVGPLVKVLVHIPVAAATEHKPSESADALAEQIRGWIKSRS